MKKTVSMALSLALLLTGMSLFRASATDADTIADTTVDTSTAHEEIVSDIGVPDTPAPDVETPDPEMPYATNPRFLPSDASEEEKKEMQEKYGYYIDENGFCVYQCTGPSPEDYALTPEQLNASTEELLEAILSVPLPLLSMHLDSTDTVEDDYECHRLYFNGFQELEKRPDAGATILSKLEQLAAITNPTSDDKDAIFFLSDLFRVSVYREQITDIEKAYGILQDAYDQRYNNVAEEIQAPYSESMNQIAYAAEEEGFDHIPSGAVATTTSGNIVELMVLNSPDFLPDEQIRRAYAWAQVYQMNVLGYATARYNCHSYAWYMSSTTNPYWIEDGVYAYLNDEHTREFNTPSIGSIVVYYSAATNGIPLHSAIVTDVNGNNVTCVSKWGAEGLFEHDLTHVPMDYTENGRLHCRYYTYYTSHSYIMHNDDPDVHKQVCTFCGDTISAPHSCTVTIKNSSNHIRTCTICHWSTTEAHLCTVTNINSGTHTRVCNTCGWSATEAHVEDKRTGRCITCGLKGPFMVDISSLPVLPEDTQSDETEDIVA